MVLRIDSSDRNVIKVFLKKGERALDSLFDENKYGSQVLLPLIKKLLEKNNINFKDLKGIEVELGPGSFTGLKIGASVANALGFSLNIPVNGKDLETDLHYK